MSLIYIDRLLQGWLSNMHEVLELVLSSSDAGLLCKATILTSYHTQMAQTRIRQDLPELLVDAVKQAASKMPRHERQAS